MGVTIIYFLKHVLSGMYARVVVVVLINSPDHLVAVHRSKGYIWPTLQGLEAVVSLNHTRHLYWLSFYEKDHLLILQWGK